MPLMYSLLLITPLSLLPVACSRLKLSEMMAAEFEIAEALNTVMVLVRKPDIFITLVIDQSMPFPDVSKVEAKLGVGMFEVSGGSQKNNFTQLHISMMVGMARQLRQVSRSMIVAVVSDDPTFLATFSDSSLKGSLLVWSTRFLVVTRLPLQHVQLLANTLSKTNSMLILLEHTPILRYNAYTYQPYSKQDATPLLVASWVRLEAPIFRNYHPFFLEKFNTLSEGPRLVAREPLATEKTKLVDDPRAPGGKRPVILSAKITVLETVAQAMNFTYDYVAPPDGAWGIKLMNGSWTGMMRMVMTEEVDIGLGLYGITAQRSEAVDFTLPLNIIYGRLMAGRSDFKEDTWSFLLPLGPIVWVALLASLLGVVAILELSSTIFIKPSRQTSTFSSIRVLLQQDVYGVSGWQWCEHVVVGVWMLATLVLTRSYAGNLMSLLAVRHISMPIQSLRDVVDNPVTLHVPKGTVSAQALLNARKGILQDVGNLRFEGRFQTISAGEIDKVVDTLVRHGDNVHINFDMIIMMMMAYDFTQKGRCDFYMGKEEFLPLMFAMAGPKGSPLIPAMNRRIMSLTEAGMYWYWTQLYTPNISSCLNPPNKLSVKSSLSLTSAWGMLVFLAGGMVVSCLVLGLEVIYSRLKLTPAVNILVCNGNFL